MIYTQEELDKIAEAEADRIREEKAKQDSPVVEDRWAMINLLENTSVRKRDVPERYHKGWENFFGVKKRNLISQTEYSKLYRYLILKGILTVNF